MTDRAGIMPPRPRRGVAAVVLAVLVPVLLWAGTGNTFAAHMGAGAEPRGHLAHLSVDAPENGAVARTTGTVPHDAESSHVLHLLGGCIALPGAALLLLGAWVSSRRRPTPARSSTADVVALGRHGRSWWRPPALSPPTTSPVLRT